MECLYCDINPVGGDETCLCESCRTFLEMGDLVVTDVPGRGRVIRWRDGDPLAPEVPGGDPGRLYYPELAYCDPEDEPFLSQTLDLFVSQTARKLKRRRVARAVIRAVRSRGADFCTWELDRDDWARVDKPGLIPWKLMEALNKYRTEVEEVLNDDRKKRPRGVPALCRPA